MKTETLKATPRLYEKQAIHSSGVVQGIMVAMCVLFVVICALALLGGDKPGPHNASYVDGVAVQSDTITPLSAPKDRGLDWVKSPQIDQPAR